MGITKQQRATWPMRGKVCSPGAPSLPREHSVRFWEAIARGQTTEEAAAGAGVASAVGTRWFRQAGVRMSTNSGPSVSTNFGPTSGLG